MEREKFIKVSKDRILEKIKWHEQYSSIAIASAAAIKAYESILSQGIPIEDDSWIEIKDGCKMPDYDEYVLWVYNDGNKFIECLDKDGGNYFILNVTHWQPLPPNPSKQL